MNFRLITNKEIESVIKKKIPRNKSPRADRFIDEIYQTCNTYPSQAIAENFRGKNTSKHILWGQQHLDTKTRQDTVKKQNYNPISMMKLDAKILNRILVNLVQQYIKRIIHHDQVGFDPGMQEWLKIQKSMWYTTLTNWKIKIIWSSY